MNESADAVPKHVGIIIDGNRRWAKTHNLPIIDGHRRGYSKLKDVMDYAIERGIQEVSAFVFALDNWKREQQEVTNLMKLAKWVLTHEVDEMHKKNIRIRTSGLREKLAPEILKLIDKAVEKTKANSKATINLCFNYGGRRDIVEAVRQLIREGAKDHEITEKLISNHLSTAGLGDVDLVIRTSEYRLSNFLPWESVYAEIYFIGDILWPDFSKADFDKALAWFANRKRRFGS